MASSSFPSWRQKFQVYLSFRGEDIRNNFTSHLYAALKRDGINAYVDDRLERGEEISTALLRAIEESTISIIILSENYASSSWCLDELSKILECKKTMGQKVVPIHYRVDPSNVRLIRGSFEKAFKRLQERFQDREDKVEGWRAALVEVASLSGHHLPNDRSESQVVEEIVQDILKKLRGSSQARYVSALEEETDVCFCVFNSKNCNSEWYVFEIPKSDSVSGKELGYPEGQVVTQSMHATRGDSNLIKIGKQGPVATLAHKRHVNSVALGSIIYCIGIDKSIGIDKNIGIDSSIGIDENIGIDESIGIDENIFLHGLIGVYKSIGMDKNIGIDKSIGIGESRIRNWPDHYASNVYCFDINCPGQGWYPGPSMMARRFLPDTLVMDFKLYVMGGVYAVGGVDAIDFLGPWVEVFDPITGKWEALPDPPHIIQKSRLVYAACHDDGESKILVGTYDKNDSIYEYNVANRCWRQLPGHNMSFGYSGPAVAFDNKLYWFTETGHLFAYDLHQKVFYKGRVDKRLKDFDHHFKLIHLGGDQLCLLWVTDAKSDSDSDSDSDYEFESGPGFNRGSRFHCYKFEVSMGIKNGKAWLKACKNTSQSFIIDEAVSFVDGMLLNGWSGEELTRKRVELLYAKDPMEEDDMRIELVEIQSATGNFDNDCCIDEGAFAKVYKGVLRGKEVAIKKKKPERDETEPNKTKYFKTEIAALRACEHPNIVKIIGYYMDEKEHIIVLEYVARGSLYRLLHARSPDDAIIDWNARLEIALDIASAMAYLHTKISIIHRDLKTKNILLDEDLRAKVADFGSIKSQADDGGKVHTNVIWTPGYMCPHYARTGSVGPYSDVYAFGVILLELISGKKAADPNTHTLLADWARTLIMDGKHLDLLDHHLVGKIEESVLKDVAKLAMECVAVEIEDRPSMTHICSELLSVKDKNAKIQNTVYEVEKKPELEVHFSKLSSAGGSREGFNTIEE